MFLDLTEAEVDDQLRKYDIDGDFQMVSSEFGKMILSDAGN